MSARTALPSSSNESHYSLVCFEYFFLRARFCDSPDMRCSASIAPLIAELKLTVTLRRSISESSGTRSQTERLPSKNPILRPWTRWPSPRQRIRKTSSGLSRCARPARLWRKRYRIWKSLLRSTGAPICYKASIIIRFVRCGSDAAPMKVVRECDQ